MRVLFVLAALVLPAVAEPPDAKALKAIQEFSARWFQARPKSKFQEWDADARAKLLEEARGFELAEGHFAATLAAVWKPVKKHGPKGKRKKGRIYIEDHGYTSRFTKNEMWAHAKGGGKNKGLIIGLHGGGEGAGSADTGWSIKGCNGIYPQGLLIHGDNWNRVHGEKQILTLIEIAKAQNDIDPDRVYVAGFSMGGTGSWHMAGRFPDLFAGAAPCNGVLMARPKSQVQTPDEVVSMQPGLIPNVANLALYFCTGGVDKNCRPGTFLYAWNELTELKERHQGLYTNVHFDYFQGLAHTFGPGLPSKYLRALAAQRRNTYPERLIWEYAADPHPVPDSKDKTGRYDKNWFYWLRHEAPSDGMLIQASRNGNTFTIDCPFDTNGLTILLRPEMIDVQKDVVVMMNGKQAYKGKPKPSFSTMIETLDVALDKRLTFDRAIVLAE